MPRLFKPIISKARLPLMVTEGLKRGVSLERIVEMLSVNPAKLFNRLAGMFLSLE